MPIRSETSSGRSRTERSFRAGAVCRCWDPGKAQYGIHIFLKGTFLNMRPVRSTQRPAAEVDKSTDTWDTINWLLGYLPNHNAQVGMIGIS